VIERALCFSRVAHVIAPTRNVEAQYMPPS
jgi:hypothetical protein